MPSSFACSPDAERSASPMTRYEIDDRFTVQAVPASGETVDVWCPVIQDTPYQRALSIAIEAPPPWTVNREPDHGNPMLHARLSRPFPGDPTVRIRYLVERQSVPHMLDPGWVRPLDSPALFARSLWPEQFVDVNDTTRKLARDVFGDEANVLVQARRIYEHVAEP